MRFNGKLLKGDGTIPMMREEWLVGQRIKKLCFFPINNPYLGTLNKNNNSNNSVLLIYVLEMPTYLFWGPAIIMVGYFFLPILLSNISSSLRGIVFLCWEFCIT